MELTDIQMAQLSAWQRARDTLQHQVVIRRGAELNFMPLMSLTVQPGDQILHVVSPHSARPLTAEAAA